MTLVQLLTLINKIVKVSGKENTMKNNKGFTLIELIIVLVIMGILAAVIVPRFFNLEVKAHQKVEEAVIGGIRAGLLTYSANQLVTVGVKKFPAGGSLVLGGVNGILDEVPDSWSVVESGTDSTNIQYNSRGDSLVKWTYYCPSPYTSYTLGSKVATAK